MKKTFISLLLIVAIVLCLMPTALASEKGSFAAGENKALTLDGTAAGTYNIAGDADKGYTLLNANGKYVALEDGRITESRSAFTWSYDGGLYAQTYVENGCCHRWRWWAPRAYTAVCLYLAADEKGLTTSSAKVTATTAAAEAAAQLKNAVTKVEVYEHYERGYHGWFFWFHSPSYYEYTIRPVVEGVSAAKVEYGESLEALTQGSSFTSRKKLTEFYIQITDSNGMDTQWEYKDGKATLIKKAQNIEKPTAEEKNIGTDSITLTPIPDGHGATKYGISKTKGVAPKEEEWQEDTAFTDLSADTPYYFYAKYEGDDYYEAVISDCTEITTASGGNCLAAGTQITMADGSFKSIEDIDEGDAVLTFNHETGVYEAQKVCFVWKSSTKKKAFTLHFGNGETLSIVGEHDLFEQESLQYVTVYQSTAESFIGKHYYSAADGKYVELTGVTYGDEPVDYYSIYTEFNANCMANGMLSLPDDDQRLDIYKFNEDLTIDHAQLEADIEEFGLYEYPANAVYSKEQYDAWSLKYVYVMIGKGIGTWDEFVARRDAFFANEN